MSVSRIPLLLLALLFMSCSHSTSPNGTGTLPSKLTVGDRYQYNVWAYDLWTGDSLAFTEVDTVRSTHAAFYGRTNLVQFNDSARTMLPYTLSVESGMIKRVIGYMGGPAYYDYDASGDLWYPAFLRIHDTTGGAIDSTMTWWRLPFASKQPQSYSTWNGTGTESLDAIRSLSDSTFLLTGKGYITRRVEIQHKEVHGNSEVHIRLAYVPELQTIVQATWLLPAQGGAFVPVGAKSLTRLP